LKLALLGGADSTRGAAVESKADEIWTLNWFYLYDWVPRIDRLFEMHPIWLYGQTGKPEHQKIYDHWKWLKQSKKPYPVYMLTDLAAVPSCVRYPIEEVTRVVFGNLLSRGETPSSFYSSTVDYMLALAIYEKITGITDWSEIELYGIEMGSMTEYRYQREGSAFFIGRAIGAGIRITLPSISILLRSKKYGYEGSQMIFRQDIERMLAQFEQKRLEAAARLQHAEGRLSVIVETGTKDEIFAANQACTRARDDLMVASGAEQTVIYQLREIDLEEPELTLESPIANVISTE
jgi:hypothetical protein